jgi:hypothetical protein
MGTGSKDRAAKIKPGELRICWLHEELTPVQTTHFVHMFHPIIVATCYGALAL